MNSLLCSENFEIPQKRTFNAERPDRSSFGMVIQESCLSPHVQRNGASTEKSRRLATGQAITSSGGSEPDVWRTESVLVFLTVGKNAEFLFATVAELEPNGPGPCETRNAIHSLFSAKRRDAKRRFHLGAL